MLQLGVIGLGRRAASMARLLGAFRIPYAVTAVADPRKAELAASGDPLLSGTRFYATAQEMLAAERLDGVMVGTRCRLHTEMACAVAEHRLPIFLEKPVAITFAQLRRLSAAFADYPAPTVVSFPLRLTPLVQAARERIAAGEIGTVEHVVAWNDVPYGSVYYHSWYRDYQEAGGLWLQKATHDIDYLTYLVGARPQTVAAMQAQRVYGGDKPFDLRCVDCAEYETCPESPFNLFYERYEGEAVPDMPARQCLFAQGIRNQDLGNLLIEFEGGVQASYTQNFFARHRAARRGARLYGYRGTLEFDWYENRLRLFRHQSPAVETLEFTGDMPHFGGDRELALDWLRAMRDGAPSRSPMEAGILSALTCLWARESAASRRFCEVVMPEGDAS